MAMGLACAAITASGRLTLAQPAQPPAGVRLSGEYGAGARPGVLVLPVQERGGAPARQSLRDSVRSILMRDLDYGDRVTIIGSPSRPRQVPMPVGGPINFGLARRLGAAAVVEPVLDGATLTVTVHDVGRGARLQARQFPLAAAAMSAAWRLALHGASDEVERWITGVRGIAQTQIAFTRGDDIVLAHADGAVMTRLATGGGRPMSAAFDPAGERVAYSLMTDGGTQIMVRDVADPSSARSVRRLTGVGLNTSPTFSPDGRVVFYAAGDGIGTNIFAVPVTGGPRRPVTVSERVENTSPALSPNGRTVVFSSNRTGRPEIWRVSADGGSPEIVTDYEYGVRNERHSPDWSPDNRLIAYHAGTSAGYQLMVISLRDGSTRQLTTDGTNEDATWAPDGRHLAFASTRGRTQQIWVMDVESGRMRQLTRGAGRARLPAWSNRPSPPAGTSMVVEQSARGAQGRGPATPGAASPNAPVTRTPASRATPPKRPDRTAATARPARKHPARAPSATATAWATRGSTTPPAAKPPAATQVPARQRTTLSPPR
jgi:TolB protein